VKDESMPETLPDEHRELLARIEELRGENARLKAELDWAQSSHDLAEHWRGVFEMANFGLTRVKFGEDTFTEVNPTYAAKRGYTPEEMAGMSVYAVHPPEHHERIKAQVRELDACGHLIFEAEHVRKDGSRFPVLMEIVVLKDPSGKPVSRVACSFDLTTLKQARERELHIETLYRSIFEQSLDSILLSDARGRVLKANPAALALFGLTEAEMLYRDRMDLVDPSDDRLSGLLRQRRETGGAKGQLRFRRKDGTLFEAELTSVRMPHVALDVENCVIIRDMSERAAMEGELKASREFLRETQRIARLGGWQVNPDLNYCSWTEGVHWILETPEGYIPDYAQGVFFVVESHRDQVREAIDQTWRTGEPRRLECEMVTHNGKGIWCEITAIRVTDLAGIRSVMGTIQDITSRKLYERDLIAANIAAVSANRIKTEFLANMSHELRTPLNGIMGMLQLCQYAALPPETAEYVNLAYDCSHNLLDIINNILVITQAEQESGERCSSRFSPAALVRDALAVYSARKANPAVTLSLTLDLAGLPEYIYGDAFRIRQILGNILDNAYKFTEEGTIRIDVSAIRQPGDLARVRLLFEVADPGIGIDVQDMDLIFEKFTQADATNTRRFGGAGMGLAIVKRLLPLVGGTACVSSTPGEGTVFLFTAEIGLFESWANVAAERTSAARSRYASLKILLVEDDLANQITIRSMVEKIGHRAVAADSGDKVLEALDGGNFDLVLLDIQMPGVSGLEAASRIRASGRKYARIPIIAVSADTSPANRQACLSVGMDAFLAKPLELHALAKEIDQCRPWPRAS
jgi:PAS domain S-box-containing protein